MRYFIGFTALLLSGCMTGSLDENSSAPWVAIDADFPDPAVIKADDGLYYAYAT